MSTGDWRLEAIEPVAGRVSDLLAQATSGPDLLIYIHGYRNTFEGSALDAARLSDGIRFRGETMVFSWPSKAGFLDYAYDRESAVWSRDAFERVLAAAMANPNIGRIHIVAHSMGTLLALEALRQVYGRYGDAGADRIGAVIFASPDIDVDVFASSVARIGPLAQKITVITATNDRALALAGRVAGGVTRVGAADTSGARTTRTARGRRFGARLWHRQPRPVPVERRSAPADPPLRRQRRHRRLARADQRRYSQTTVAAASA